MRYLAILLLASCTLNTPISQFDLPDNACTEGQAEFDGTAYNLHITDDADQIYAWCGPDAMACIKGNDIYTGVPCEEALAHELNHLVGNDWVDMPRYSR